MEAHEAMERFERSEELAEARHRFSRHAAVLVAILAAMLAIATLAGNDATKNTILDQAKSTDAFNELEANSLKKHINGNDSSLLRLLTSRRPAAANATAAALDRAVAKKYAPNEVRLLNKATAFERDRDRAEEHHRAFQVAEAGFQIAIVLTSVGIVAGAIALVWVAGGLGIAGLVFLIDGFANFWHVP